MYIHTYLHTYIYICILHIIPLDLILSITIYCVITPCAVKLETIRPATH